jgi:hypothetical protein
MARRHLTECEFEPPCKASVRYYGDEQERKTGGAIAQPVIGCWHLGVDLDVDVSLMAPSWP